MPHKHIIHLFGASGSGTTTIGRDLCRTLGWFHMDTDDYFWEQTDPPYTTKRPLSARLDLMRRDMETHQNVVISGSLTDWGDVLIPCFTLAVRVETDTALRIERLKARERAHFGARIDPGGDMYTEHMAFLRWAADYDEGGIEMRSRRSHDQWQKLLTCPLLLVDGGRPLSENRGIILKHLEK